MDPDGQSLAPGTSHESPPFTSAQLDTEKEQDGEESSEKKMGPSTDPGRNAQRRFKSSAFPSSLSWDSDSEKETPDEEEQQNFCNPHGLATQSPGSPSSGLRLDENDDQEAKKSHPHHNKSDLSVPVVGPLGQADLPERKNCDAPEDAETFQSKLKPKEGCQVEEEETTPSERKPDESETKEPQRDVYSFPGDSDPESPPPAPWAHCTFIQRCRKKRVLLRPFSGLGTLKCTSPESDNLAEAETAEDAKLSKEEVYDFEEVSFREGAVETITFGHKVGTVGQEDEENKMEESRDIFTCVECSIYFKKQVHLQEHMVEHRLSDKSGGRSSEKSRRFRCDECGWNLPSRLILADHSKKHQESRLKILEEIEKLNENGKAKEMQTAVKHVCLNPDVTQYTGLVSDCGKMSELEMATCSPPPPASVSKPEAELLTFDLDKAPANSVRTATKPRTVSGCHRRRFVCSKCNFSTRTPQALTNHSKIHNRKKPTLQPDSPSPETSSGLTSTSLACGHCAFLTTSENTLREHQTLVHPEQMSISRDKDEQTSQSLSSRSSKNQMLDSQDKSQQGFTASEDGAPAESAAPFTSPGVFKRPVSSGPSAGEKAWTDTTAFSRDMEEDKQPDGEVEKDQRIELNSESFERDKNSSVEGKQHTTAQDNTDESKQPQSAALSPAAKKAKRTENQLDLEKERKVFFLRKSSRVTAAPVQTDSEDDVDDKDDIDDERLRCFLSESFLDEDKDEIDEDEETTRSVERKCPYCPDRFHNGIGLANHVRGHLNRVGVSYNVRHFISPEEVNAIEKKFSYQKKKKKVANFDPDTFSVMHCEFCSAGFDTRAGLSSHARAHLRDFGITNWDVTISPIHILRELFSRRPDLVIPTAPPKSSGSSLDEEEDYDGNEEQEEIIEVKLEGDMTERPLSACGFDESASVSQKDWKKEDDYEGDDGEAAEEEDEDDVQLSALEGLKSSGKTDSLFPKEDADTQVNKLKCELCDSEFKTKRGLSIHTRSHLRRLGVKKGDKVPKLQDGRIERSCLESFNHSSSIPLKDEEQDNMDLDEKPIPISILAKAAKTVPLHCSSPTSTASSSASPAPSQTGSLSSIVKKAPISSLLPVSSPLRSLDHKVGGTKCLTANVLGTSSIASAKPLWAPQESDAPLNLTLEVDPDKDIVCQLCGAWFETRKGLSSHARAHLRHFGVEYSESRGSPIDLLSQLIDTDDFKHKASSLQVDSPTELRGLTTTLPSAKQSLLTLSSSSPSLLYKVTTAGSGRASKATSSSSLFSPSAKRIKTSSLQVFRLSSGELMALPHNEPPKEIGCEFCGEYFENRKGLSSHARSHLRQMGITEWSVNGSPIDTLREVITRRGLPCALPLKALKTPPPSSPKTPRSPMSPSSSPSATLLSRLPFSFARPPALSKSSSAPPTSSSGLILKLKPEPVQLEITAPAIVGRSGGFSTESVNSGWSGSDNVFPLNLAVSHEVEPTRDIRCEFCGEYFENRKGLSSHARSHLRQMGITEWSVNGSPIDTLREVMHKRGRSHSDLLVKKESSRGANSPSWETTSGARSSEGLGVLGFQSSKFCKSPLSLLQSGPKYQKQGLGGPTSTLSTGKFFRISPLGKRPLSEDAKLVGTAHLSPHRLKNISPLPQDFSIKRKPSPEKPPHQDPSCELCGFYFENRKALASHARAHLRQFGVTEWSVNGSPIETLSAWIRSRPQKVLEMHRSYVQGNRSALKKKTHSSSSSSSQWSSSLAVSLVQPMNREISHSASKTSVNEAGTSLQALGKSGRGSPAVSRLGRSLPLQAQVARSELNVRLPRGFERRPLKHPSFPDGAERDSGTPKPPRTGTIPALVPKPPSYPLVKLVGKVYTLKCRFCEMEFTGPLSVQEDWIRHLQQHILKMNYDKPAATKAAEASDHSSTPASTSTSRTASTPPPTDCAPTITSAKIVKVAEEKTPLIPTSIPLPTQTA